MAEKTPNQQLAEKLLYKPAYVADKDADVKQKAHDFAEGYKKFLDAGKTEREVAAESEQMLKDAGYQQFDPKKTYKPGDKIYFVQYNKAVVASTIGTKSFEDGFHLVIAHTDSPRLDLRPTPLYESDHLSYFKTHYYGGIRKYQWGTIPLSIHGVFTREDGSTVTVRVGEDENDPVFCITDLLPHLGAEQNARPLKDGIKALGTDPREFTDINPFLSSVEITLKADYANNDSLMHITRELKSYPNVGEVKYQRDLVDKVNANIAKISIVLLALAVLLTVVSFSLINNTVKLGIYARRFSIHTMKLVGASWGFIRRPFLRQAVLIGLLASILACAALGGCFYALYYYEPEIVSVLTLDVLAITAGAVFLSGIVITAFCAILSVNKFLKMKAGDLYKI